MDERIVFDPKYAPGFLHDFEHWRLVVSYAQHTLGAFIIFATRKVEKISDLKPEELLELPRVMRAAESALTALFQPERFNYLQLGNQFNNLHFHAIPRYAAPRQFGGREWIDGNFGHMPITDFKTVMPEDFILQLKEAILTHLSV